MPRTTRATALLPLVVAAALAFPACSAVVPGTAHPLGAGPSAAAATATDDPVEWINRVCGAMLPLTRVSPPPHVDYSDLDEVRKSLDQHQAALHTAAVTGLEQLDRVGPAPTPGGDQLVGQLRSSLTALQAAATPSPSGGAPSRPGGSGAVPAPGSALVNDPELVAAAAEAENCREVNDTFFARSAQGPVTGR